MPETSIADIRAHSNHVTAGDVGFHYVVRALIAQYRHRDAAPSARPAQAAPVAIVARLFPLLSPQ